jgi:heme A synthase
MGGAWRLVAIALAAGVFLEAAFAGAMLSGQGWARAAHGATAGLLVAAAAVAGLAALATRRGRSLGLGWTLLALAAGLIVQAALGALTAHRGANLLWAHVPLGVLLTVLVAQAALAPRRPEEGA